MGKIIVKNDGVSLTSEQYQQLMDSCQKIHDETGCGFEIRDFNVNCLGQEEIPRRNNLSQNTPTELEIRSLINKIEIENIGADPLLTDVITTLQIVFNTYADYVDKNINQLKDTGYKIESFEEYSKRKSDKKKLKNE